MLTDQPVGSEAYSVHIQKGEKIMHNTWKRNCSAGMALLLGGSLLLGGCGNNAVQTTAETSAVVVDMEQAQTGKLTLQNSFVGTVSPEELVYVIPFASGTVTDTYFEVPGMSCSKSTIPQQSYSWNRHS